MGSMCNFEEGDPITLVFDCISLGKHEINTMDGVKLKDPLKVLCKRINTPYSKIGDVSYNYTPLNKDEIIKNLGLKHGNVLAVKFKEE